MDMATLEREIEARTPEEQDRLVAYLTAIRLKRDSAYGDEIEGRLDDRDGWMSFDPLKKSLEKDRVLP